MEEKSNYSVYMHINKLNKKVYIGITGRHPEKRWGHNGYCYKPSKDGYQSYFWNAIQKYGWDNFDHIVLYKGMTKKQAEEIEISLIKKYDSTNRDKGYNISHGGNTCGTVSDETKRKISQANTGKPSWRKGVPMTKETKDKISLKNTSYKTIYQYDRHTGEFISEYETLSKASEDTGISKESISQVCNHRAKSIGGYIFRYKNDKLKSGQPLSQEDMEESSNTHFRPVKQYEKDGTFIREYLSIKDAEMAFGKKQGSTLIWHCVNKKKPSAMGYLWSYSDEDVIIPVSKREKSVNQFDLEHKFIKQFSSVKEAAAFIGVTSETLIKNIKKMTNKGYRGYIYEYA